MPLLIQLCTDSMYSLPAFEHQLVMYVTADQKETFNEPFDLSTVPVVTREQADAEDRKMKLTSATPTLKAPSTGPKKQPQESRMDANGAATASAPSAALKLLRVPELKAYGPVLKSSAFVELTESETEYVVSAVKHIFKEHIVLQFDIKNTLSDTVLEEVSVVATPLDEDGAAGLEEEFIIPVSKLVTDQPATVYVSFKRMQGEKSFPVTGFTNVLKFTSKEIDPSTGQAEESGYDDEYQVENLELTGSDYVVPTFASNFGQVWEQIGEVGEEDKVTLQLDSVKNIAGRLFLGALSWFESTPLSHLVLALFSFPLYHHSILLQLYSLVQYP